MERFKKILVSVDACQDWSGVTPHSVSRAIRIARDTGAEVHIVGTVNEINPVLRKLLDKSEADLLAEYEQNLGLLVDSIQDADVTITDVVRLGRPFLELVREVKRTKADLLIRDISEDRESHEAFISGLDMRLVRNCPCRVWMVKRDPTGFEHIVAAIDPVSEYEEVKEINREILDVAQSITRWENGQLHVVGAIEALGKHGEPILSRLKPSEVEAYQHQLQETARSNVRKLLRGTCPKPKQDRIRLDAGSPAKVIRNYAREIDADVIVIGTANRTHTPALLVGDTAEQVLHTARSSVLCLKPVGFRSPVT